MKWSKTRDLPTSYPTVQDGNKCWLSTRGGDGALFKIGTEVNYFQNEWVTISRGANAGKYPSPPSTRDPNVSRCDTRGKNWKREKKKGETERVNVYIEGVGRGISEVGGGRKGFQIKIWTTVCLIYIAKDALIWAGCPRIRRAWLCTCVLTPAATAAAAGS